MIRSQLSRLAVLGVLAVAAGVAGVTVAQARPPAINYTITDLGSRGTGVAHGFAINASGQVTGDSVLSKQVQVPCDYPQQQKCFANPDHAFFWGNGTMTGLGTLSGGLDSQGVAINDAGDVVGPSSGSFPGNPFLWNARDHKLIALRSSP